VAYSGRYTIKDKAKYLGNPTGVIYRSLWEKHVMKWCDDNPQVVGWCSEEVVIPYLCQTDNKMHRYFMDFLIKYKDGRTVLVEVKPHAQTLVPKSAGRPRRKVLSEGLTYIKNQSKWKETARFVADRGWHFEIWTERELTSMGIMPKSTKPLKPFPKKKAAPKKKVAPKRPTK